MLGLNEVRAVVILGLVAIFKGTCGGPFEGQQCAPENRQLFRTCFQTFGFQSGPRDQFAPNVTALIPYCSAQGRTSGEHCVNEFPDICPALFLASDSPTFRKRQQIASKTLDFVCSNINVLENKIDCVRRRMTNVNRCVLESVTAYFMEIASANITIDLDFLQNLMMRVGRHTMGCYVDALKEPCGSAVSNLIGNFLYGLLIYPFED